jgi:hypothetical protein
MNDHITKDTVAQKLSDHLQHKLSLQELVDWAETAMMDGEFDPGEHDRIRDVIARLGLADIRAFGLTWQDCEDFFTSLGYKARIHVAVT